VIKKGQIRWVGLLALIYALCYSAIKQGLEYAPPLRFAGMRASLGGLALLAVAAVIDRNVVPPRRLWRSIPVLALAGSFLEYGAMFLSPGRTGAGIASVLGNTGPLLVILLAALMLREHITWSKLAALALGTVSVSLIAYPAVTAADGPGMLPFILPLTAAAASAFSSVFFKRLEAGDALLQVAAWQLLLGGIPLLLVSSWLEPGAVRWQPACFGVVGFMGFVGTAVALSLWYRLVQKGDVGSLSLLLFAVPLIGLLLAAMFFGERIGRLEAIGVVGTVAALAIAAHEAQRLMPPDDAVTPQS
jgi:drug/metabolite transporter (DMT)-like permease